MKAAAEKIFYEKGWGSIFMRKSNKSEKKGKGLAVKVIVAVLAVVCVFFRCIFSL